MSVCTFFASNVPLHEVAPSQEYPLEIDIDKGTVYDGDADDNFFLISFEDVSDYTDKKYGVRLEWNYTDGRAKQLIKYIEAVLKETDTVELWHVWLQDYYEYEDSPVIKKKKKAFSELAEKDIKELDNSNIWNVPDKNYPNRPSYYCLVIER